MKADRQPDQQYIRNNNYSKSGGALKQKTFKQMSHNHHYLNGKQNV